MKVNIFPRAFSLTSQGMRPISHLCSSYYSEILQMFIHDLNLSGSSKEKIPRPRLFSPSQQAWVTAFANFRPGWLQNSPRGYKFVPSCAWVWRHFRKKVKKASSGVWIVSRKSPQASSITCISRRAGHCAVNVLNQSLNVQTILWISYSLHKARYTPGKRVRWWVTPQREDNRPYGCANRKMTNVIWLLSGEKLAFSGEVRELEP